MNNHQIVSKLPAVGTSIFSEMSVLANQTGAINLSQGFPEFDTPEFLKESIKEAIDQGKNQYSPSSGQAELIEQIGQLIHRQYAVNLSADKSITVTSGATEALFVAIHSIVQSGDEVIIFDPAYDSYEPAVELAGGKCVHIALSAPEYSVNWQTVAEKITSKTKAIIINSPHNPTGTLLSEADMKELQRLVITNKLFLISDEVYEFITFDNYRHESVLRYPELFKRSFVISSFGKTFHCTGWKMGYCTAPELLTNEFRKLHQYVTFCSFSPAQFALSQMLKNNPEHINSLANFYQQKRDLLVNALSNSRLKVLPSQGTYFLLVDYSDISDLDDYEFCCWLTREVGVAAIPLSPFCESDSLKNGVNNKIVRLCFAKNENTLEEAAKKLCQL